MAHPPLGASRPARGLPLTPSEGGGNSAAPRRPALPPPCEGAVPPQAGRGRPAPASASFRNFSRVPAKPPPKRLCGFSYPTAIGRRAPGTRSDKGGRKADSAAETPLRGAAGAPRKRARARRGARRRAGGAADRTGRGFQLGTLWVAATEITRCVARLGTAGRDRLAPIQSRSRIHLFRCLAPARSNASFDSENYRSSSAHARSVSAGGPIS